MVLLFTLLGILTQSSQAATRPPISGQWISGETDRLQIKVQGQSLTVTTGPSAQPLTYTLDGSTSKSVTVTAGGEQWKHESQARWVGNAILVVTTTTRNTGQSWEWLTIYTLDDETGDLKSVTVDQGHHASDGMVTRVKSYRRMPSR